MIIYGEKYVKKKNLKSNIKKQSRRSYSSENWIILGESIVNISLKQYDLQSKRETISLSDKCIYNKKVISSLMTRLITLNIFIFYYMKNF